MDKIARIRVRRGVFRFWFQSAGFLFVILGVPAVVLYLKFAGLGPNATKWVEEALAKVGVDATVGRLVIDPIDGLVARDLSVVAPGEPDSPLAEIRHASLSIRWSALAAGRLEFEKIVVHGGEVLLSTPGARRVALEKFDATLIFSPGQVRVANVSCLLAGIEVKASGTLLNPEALRGAPPKANAGPSSAQGLMESVRTWVDKFQFEGGRPHLNVQFGGDFGQPDTLRAEFFELHAGKVRIHHWTIDSIHVSGDYRDRVLSIQSIEMHDRKGRFSATALWQTLTGALSFEVENTMDFRPFLPSTVAAGALDELRFEDSPDFSVTGELQLGAGVPKGQVHGEMHAGKFKWRTLDFDSLQTAFAWKDGVLFLREARLERRKGVAIADIYLAPGDFRLRAKSSVNPQPFFAFADARARMTLDALELIDAPLVRLSLWGPRPDFAHVRGEGEMRFGRAKLRGIEITSGKTKIEIEDRALTYRDLEIRRPEGVATGTVVYDIGKREVRFSDVVSRLNVYDALYAIDPKLAKSVEPFRFRDPPLVGIDGMLHLEDPTRNKFDVTMDASGLKYDVAGKTLPFGKSQGNLRFRGRRLSVDLPRAELFGGRVGVQADVSLDSSDRTYRVSIKPDRVPFLPLAKLYFNYSKTQGFLSADYTFRAKFGETWSMVGAGTVNVRDGNVFAIPVLGALSEVIESVIPGMGYQPARMASASFTMADGIVNTSDFLVEGQGFEMRGEGDLDIAKNRMDFSIRVNAKGVAGIVLLPVSKVFEYVSDGKLSKPDWRPKNLPWPVDRPR